MTLNFNQEVRRLADIGGYRFTELGVIIGSTDNIALTLVNEDWSSNNLIMKFALGPGRPALGTLPVSVTTDTSSWRHMIECNDLNDDVLPCGVDLDDLVTTSLLRLDWVSTSFDNIPPPDEIDTVSPVYFEISENDTTSTVHFIGEMLTIRKIQ